jgi:deoxyribose-phosphate aldolase
VTSPPRPAPIPLASLVDATLLRPEATAEDVVRLCAEAVEFDAFAVCISPPRVALAVETLAARGGPRPVAAVAGFPSGAHLPAVKAREARAAVEAGAAEIDVVIDLGKAAEGHWSAVESELAAVRAEVPGVLKVILETALLSREGIIACCRVAEAAGADFVKTSSGFHPAGGATLAAVATMRAAVGSALGVKASGGIRTREQAEAFVEAGANRLGLSQLRAVLAVRPAG